MGYRLNKTLKDNKKSMILIAVLWVILSIVLVAPVSYSIGVATTGGSFNFEIFIELVFSEITSFTSIGRISIHTSIPLSFILQYFMQYLH